jgi:GH18 family chitinase
MPKAKADQVQDAPSTSTQAAYNKAQVSAHSALVEHVATLEARIAELESAPQVQTTPVSAKQVPAPKGKAAKAEKLTKKAKADLRAKVGAPNSAKYTCSCGGWALSDAFVKKHTDKGHDVTTIR